MGVDVFFARFFDRGDPVLFQVDFHNSRFVVGAVLAALFGAALLLFDAPVWLALLVAAGFLAAAPVRVELPDPWRVVAAVLVPLLGAVLLMWLTQGAMDARVLPLTFDEFLLGVGIGGAVIVLWVLITGRIIPGVGIGMGLLLLLVTADYYVYAFRGTELLPTDFLAIGTAINVAGEYDYTPGPSVVRVWALFALFLFAAGAIRFGRLRRRPLTLAGAGTLAALVAAILLGMNGHTSQQWHLHGVNNNGFLLNFTLELRDSFIRRPEDYDPDALAALAATYDPPEETAGPTIIAIMDESFADFRVLGDHFNTNEPVMPFFDSLRENTIRGYALSSVYGGGTANSEYEFLTGNTLGFLPQGCVAYQQYVRGETHSIVSELKDRGYACVAMHPYLESGWMRNTVWPRLGFDETYFVDDFPRRNLVRGFVSDQGMFEKVTQVYEQRDPSRPLFLFGVTMQNHGGYRYTGYDFKTEIRLRGYRQLYPTAEQYLTLAHKTDSALETLIAYFSGVDDDVVIVFFGDHLPSLPKEFYEEIHGGTFDTLDEQLLQYEIPFFVWANYDIDARETPLTSINYLTNYVYEAAGLEPPVYTQLLMDLSDTIPALNSQGFYSRSAGAFLPFDEAEGAEREALERYWQLQYNNTFDTKNRLSIFDAVSTEPMAEPSPANG